MNRYLMRRSALGGDGGGRLRWAANSIDKTHIKLRRESRVMNWILKSFRFSVRVSTGRRLYWQSMSDSRLYQLYHQFVRTSRGTSIQWNQSSWFWWKNILSWLFVHFRVFSVIWILFFLQLCWHRAYVVNQKSESKNRAHPTIFDKYSFQYQFHGQ